MEVDENSAESNINAWFMIKLPKEQESKCSDGNDDELEKNSSAKRILDFSDSSDSSDDELEQNFPVITNGFALNGTDSSTSFTDKKEVNSSHSSKIKSSNFLIDNSSDTSNDELQQNFPIISNGFMLNGTDSSNSVSDTEELNPSDSLKLQNSSNFVNDDSTNSSDVKNNQFLSVSTMNGNLNCEDSGTLQISLPLKNSKRIFEIPDDDSSEGLNDGFVKHSTSSSNGVKLSSEKKMKSNFVLNGSSNYSIDEYEQNGTFTNEQKYVEDYSNSTNGTDDVPVLNGEKIIVLESESSKHLGKETTECLPKKSLDLKRKLCVLEDEIPSVCDAANAKKPFCFTGKH